MANRRMISKSISVSEQVNNMSLFARLLFTWMIAHADDFGRMPGSPAKVRALVVPMSTETVEDVASALQEMVDNDLIVWYEVDGVRYIQFKKWEKHQTGLHKRTESQIPPPSDARAEVQGISRNFTETPGTSDAIPSDSRNFREVPGNSRSRELELEQEQELKTAAAIERDYKAPLEATDAGGDSPLPLPSDCPGEEVYPPSVFDAIEQRMCVRMGKPSYTLVGTEFSAAKSVLDAGVPLDFVLQGIDWAFERYKPKHAGDKISSFAYCKPIILELWQAQNERKNAKATPITAIGPPKSTYGRAIVNEPDPTVEWAKEFLRQEAKASGLDSS